MTDRSHRRRRRSVLGVIATVGLLVGLIAVLPAAASGARVTSGGFNEFTANTTMDIGGHAVMVRTADGRTFVSVHVTGLVGGLTYGSHVHKQACSDNFAGGHYQFVTSMTNVTPPNEIWPGPITANGAGIGNGNTTAKGTAGSTAVSVVVHAPGGTKIACADLR
jgi:hypothetical protein